MKSVEPWDTCLALMHLRGLLARDPQMPLEHLNEVLKQRGVLDLEKKTPLGDVAPLFKTFELSWEKVRGEGTQRLFKLAAYFPEATPIPLWLLGLATGLGEDCRYPNPLWGVRVGLQELSLMETLSEDQVRLTHWYVHLGSSWSLKSLTRGKPYWKKRGTDW